jgi:hypothetical protein
MYALSVGFPERLKSIALHPGITEPVSTFLALLTGVLVRAFPVNFNSLAYGFGPNRGSEQAQAKSTGSGRGCARMGPFQYSTAAKKAIQKGRYRETWDGDSSLGAPCSCRY